MFWDNGSQCYNIEKTAKSAKRKKPKKSVREKISDTLKNYFKNNPEMVKKGEHHPCYGTKRSDDQLASQSKSLKKHWENNKKRKQQTSDRAKLVLNAPENRKKNIESILKSRNIIHTIILPSGDVVKTLNLADFCKRNRLNRSSFRDAKKRCKPYKGFQLV